MESRESFPISRLDTAARDSVDERSEGDHTDGASRSRIYVKSPCQQLDLSFAVPGLGLAVPCTASKHA